MTTYSVATPVSGHLQVHVDGCAHLPRLYAGGGGVLSDRHETASGALECARDDDERAKLAPCAKAAVKAAAEALVASHDRLGHDGTGCGCLDALDAL